MVTVRFRKDTGEMRFTYANPKAWKALQNGVINYPDGSIFAKIGIATEDNPAFISSAVPSGARRLQLMVKDSVRHKETEGWGYVFSQIMNLTREKKTKNSFAGETHKFKFETWSVKQVPENIRRRLPKTTKEIRVLSGELRQNIFQGTLDEIRHVLAQECAQSGLPALLLSSDEKRYSVVFAVDNTNACTSNEIAMKAKHSLLEMNSLYELEFCQSIKNLDL